ncbi:fumarylacetoacetate hydrolase family protein [Kribbella sp. NPDC059898]|uniref:fumarylacetoacetate hydrolase family protein n=1 Tax=Kribbella sp. NPDC059898 TaxID=3346995 RepID=UPI0036461982
MRLVTFAPDDTDGADRLGALITDDSVLDLTAAAVDDPRLRSMPALIASGDDGLKIARDLLDRAEFVRPLDSVQLRAPIPRPVKSVYCVGLNYRSHVEQNATALGLAPDIPDVPLFFTKPVTSVIGPDQPIRHDSRLTATLDYEIELAIVIGKGGTWIPREQAAEHIFGYTVVNDVSARELQWRTSQFLYGKGQDSYCPVGPAITTADAMPALDDVVLRLLVNDDVRQEEAAGNMIFAPETVVAELSRGITLEPGDIISLGTPGGCAYQMVPTQYLVPGDTVVMEVTGIGRMTNPVVEVAPARHRAASPSHP